MAEGIEFDEDNLKYELEKSKPRQTESGITGWLMKRGLAKSPKAAQMIELGVVIVAVIVAFVLLN